MQSQNPSMAWWCPNINRIDGMLYHAILNHLINMKQLFVTCLTLVSLYLPASAGHVQDSLNAKGQSPASHTFSIRYGAGLISSKVYDVASGREYSSRFGQEAQLEYQCVFSSGYGFGAIGAYNSTGYPSSTLRQLYFAPEFVMGSPRGGCWQWSWGIGAGAARYSEEDGSKWGIGFHTRLGVEYLFGKHVGIGLDLSALNGRFSDDKNNDYYKDRANGIARYALTIGLRFHL